MSLVSFMSESMSAESLMFNPLANIVRSIIANANGAMLDPSDMATMFQDAAGTTPVTAVEQPVGKILDKSGRGNHATQSVTASRPTLSARYNLLTKTEDFADAAAWGSEINLTTTSNTAIAPDGTLTGDTLTTTVVAHAKFQSFNCAPNTQYTFSFFAKRGTMTDAKYSVYDLTGAANIVAATSYYSALNADTFSRVSITFTTPANCVSCRVYPLRDSGVIGTIHVWGSDVRLGLSGPYQRVNTSTDYDTNPAYFPKYLKFDGVDDYLNLPYMGLYAGGSASVVAGVYLQPKATTQYIIGETTSASTNSRYGPLLITTNPLLLSTLIRSDSNVEFINSTNISDTLQPLPSVTSVVDTGNRVSMRTKGVLVSTANYSRTSTLTANTTTVGALAQSEAEFFAKMNLYGLIITKSALSDAQRIQCERLLARKAGVIL